MDQDPNIEVEFGDDAVDTPPKEPTTDVDAFFGAHAFRVVYQTSTFFLPQIRDMIEKREAINLRPEYQRRLRWTNIQKSKLIESLLLNVPIPPIFLYENDAARYEVMDGQQRLNAVKEFFAGEYALSGLTVLTPLNGLRYPKCPLRVKRALERASLSTIVLLLESELETSERANVGLNDVRGFVFDRLNTGGRRLNAQEIRNALNPGPLNDALLKMSRLTVFTDIFGIPAYREADPNDYYENPDRQRNILYSSMRDCELALRFVALRDRANIRGAMKAMLDRAMETPKTPRQASALVSRFEKVLTFLYELFDQQPFLLKPSQSGRRRVSAAMYDAAMIAMDKSWSSRNDIMADQSGVQGRLDAAMEDQDDFELLTGRRNTAEAVRGRISLFETILLPQDG